MLKYLHPMLILSTLILALPALSGQGLYKKISPACVEILVGGRLDGSGAIVCPSGLVLTACHVIRKQSKQYEALSPELGRKPLSLIATYRGSDLALLKLPARDKPYPALPLAREIPPEGKPVFLLGSPIFRHHLLLRGTVARRTETYSWYDGAFTNTIPICGIGAPGSSGGPWVNPKGEIIGVQVASVTTAKGHQGVSSAVPVHSVRNFIAKKENVTVACIQSAVEELWGQSPQLIKKIPSGTEGLLLRQVATGGVAAKAGLKNEDLILSADDKTYVRIEPFLAMLRKKKPGSSIELEVCSPNGENRRKVSLKTAVLE
jgi:S1-C subfamily serine protease